MLYGLDSEPVHNQQNRSDKAKMSPQKINRTVSLSDIEVRSAHLSMQETDAYALQVNFERSEGRTWTF